MIDLAAAKAAREGAGGDTSMGWIICGPADADALGAEAQRLGFRVQVRSDCPAGQAYMTDRPLS